MPRIIFKDGLIHFKHESNKSSSQRNKFKLIFNQEIHFEYKYIDPRILKRNGSLHCLQIHSFGIKLLKVIFVGKYDQSDSCNLGKVVEKKCH